MPVAEIPETGRHLHLVPDEATRAALARSAGALALPQLEASFDLTRHGRDGVRVVGNVTGLVRQNCVVTLEPMESGIEEAVDLVFEPAQESGPNEPAPKTPAKGRDPVDVTEIDPPEPLVNGVVDLGSIATEFLLLGIDPYPRQPGARFDPPSQDDPSSKPFAALAALKEGSGGDKG